MLNKIIAMAALASVACASSAGAVTIVAVDASGANTSPFALGDFGNANTNAFISNAPIALANGSITFGTGGSPIAGVYDGDVAGAASTAFFSTNLVRRNYLVAEASGSVTISFATPQTQFQLLWSTIDSYNTLVFNSAGSAPVIVTGADALNAGRGAFSSFVTITGVNFTSVTATSATAAFEFVPNVAVPEPSSIALLGAVAGLGFVRRRRKAQ